MKKYFVEIQKYLDLICTRDKENYEDKLLETAKDLMIDVCKFNAKNINEFRLLLDKLDEINK